MLRSVIFSIFAVNIGLICAKYCKDGPYDVVDLKKDVEDIGPFHVYASNMDSFTCYVALTKVNPENPHQEYILFTNGSHAQPPLKVISDGQGRNEFQMGTKTYSFRTILSKQYPVMCGYACEETDDGQPSKQVSLAFCAGSRTNNTEVFKKYEAEATELLDKITSAGVEIQGMKDHLYSEKCNY